MTKRDMAILGCKFLGIFILIKCIPMFLTFLPIGVFYIFNGSLSTSEGAAFAIQMLMWAIMMLCGVALWFQAKRVAQWMVPTDTPPATFTLHKDFVTAALSIIGLILLVISIPALLHHFAANTVEMLNVSTTHLPLSRDFIRATFQFFLGIIILGSLSPLSRLIQNTSKSTFRPVEQESISDQMSRIDMAHLGCRLLGIYLIINPAIILLSQLGRLVTKFWQQNHSLPPLMMAAQIEGAVNPLIIIAIGLWLWFGANQFAKKIAGRDFFEAPIVLNIHILPMLISFLGLVLLVKAVPGLINNLSMHFIRVHYAASTNTTFLLMGVASSTKVLLGILLFFAPRSLSDKLQNMGSASASLGRWIKNPSGSNANRP